MAGAATGIVSVFVPHGDECPCPENSPGWLAYPDSAIGPPDFFRKRSVQVQEIVLCERGIHLLFRAEQEERECDVCVVVSEPTLEQKLSRLSPDSVCSDVDLEVINGRLEWERNMFAERLRSLRSILHQPAVGNCRARFRTGFLRRAPRLYPGAPIRIRYDGRSLELTGIPDVYFRGANPH